jgi:16S rRNA (uracil1498-N3)-methyltransferase
VRTLRVHARHLPSSPDEPLVLDGDEAAHLGRVLRVKPGAEVEVFDGRGGAGRFRIDAISRRDVRLTLVERAATPAGRELPFLLTVAVATPKGKRAHRLVEALTELGATTLIPLATARGEVEPLDAAEVERWSIEAAKQCGRNLILTARPLLDVAAVATEASAHDLALLCDTVDARPLRDVLTRPRPARALVVVGPEGGFSPDERALLRSSGLLPIGLGPSVLRIETAACAVSSALVAAWA